MAYKVSKKDKNIEDFDRNKVISGVEKSGVDHNTAEAIAIEVESWVPSVAKNGIVTYSDLRSKVLEVLRSKDSNAAHNFEIYKRS